MVECAQNAGETFFLCFIARFTGALTLKAVSADTHIPSWTSRDALHQGLIQIVGIVALLAVGGQRSRALHALDGAIFAGTGVCIWVLIFDAAARALEFVARVQIVAWLARNAHNKAQQAIELARVAGWWFSFIYLLICFFR